MVNRYNFEHCCSYGEVKQALQDKTEIVEWLKDGIDKKRIVQRNNKIYIDDKELCPGAWLLLEGHNVLTVHDYNYLTEKS